ncbi:hypothetical protein GpartN1_g2675.t1 [Galdieria partita]|uniref:Zinc finger protein n=1 Tax=Galdieria partita TaxID=83374 RepID=A0A9C7UPG0_9RHOD|nr:hypothetical protein GpartN1_g2675.t1 [Galdieria partita]
MTTASPTNPNNPSLYTAESTKGKRVSKTGYVQENVCCTEEQKPVKKLKQDHQFAEKSYVGNWQHILDISEPLLELFCLHEAFRKELELLQDQVRQITIATTDQELDKFRSRLIFCRDLLLDHCCSEDRIILPAIYKKLSKEKCEEQTYLLGTELVNQQHEQLDHWFSETVQIIEQILNTPFSLEHRPLAEDDLQQSTSAVTLESDANLSPRKGKITTISDFEPPRGPLLEKLTSSFGNLIENVEGHLLEEEQNLSPLFHNILTTAEQGALLASVVIDTSQKALATLLPCAVRALNFEKRVRFVVALERYMTPEQFESIAAPLVQELSSEQWEELCRNVPNLQVAAERSINPLVEITHLHKAIRKELEAMASYTAELDPCDNLQIKSLCSRILFLQRVHNFHSLGEDEVLVSQLRAALKMHGLDDISSEHCNESFLFGNILEHIKRVASFDKNDKQRRYEAMSKLSSAVREISNHLIIHMEEEEARLLPLVRSHFSLRDQDTLIRRVMAKIPMEFLPEVFPWMLNALDAEEREKLFCNILRSSSKEYFEKISAFLGEAARRGKMDPLLWDELCLRIPELQRCQNEEADQDNGPVDEILRIHKAIRCELQKLYVVVTNLAVDEAPNPNSISAIAERFFFLRNMVNDHSKAEDNIVLPALEKRLPGISKRYEGEHCEERELFSNVLQVLQALQCAGCEDECRTLLKQLRALVRALHEELNGHLNKEEQNLWPKLIENFTKEEQVAIVADIFGTMPSERLQEMLPWLIRTLTESEQSNMLKHILQVTHSTMFERWLSTWFPLIPSKYLNGEESNVRSASSSSIDQAESGNKDKSGQSYQSSTSLDIASPRVLNSDYQNTCDAVRIQSRADLENAIRVIASDETLTDKQKTQLMQNLMLRPYFQSRGHHGSFNSDEQTPVAASRSSQDDASQGKYIETYPGELQPTFRELEDGSKQLGCSHYLRGAKIRTVCCSKFYTCRLCHDEIEDHKVGDNRYATREMLCMHCGHIQSISQWCCNPECLKRMARYYCPICKLFDDDSSRNIYHCHSCNVCRVGKGLGIDSFHCMKCNACMSMKYAKSHHCIEHSMESDCPICYQYLFTSTTPVKYLQCGHLMHVSCYNHYVKKSYICPICQRSMQDMSSYFARLDKLLARDHSQQLYRGIVSHIQCNDCQKQSDVTFHFVFHKCTQCGSYNTRVLRISRRET